MLAWYDLATGQMKPVFEPPRWARYALSHDGEWIVYTQSPDEPGQQGGNDGRHADIWKIAASGAGAPVKVTQIPSRIFDLCFAGGDQALYAVSDLIFDREFFRGQPDRLSNGETILYWNQEFRSTIWGHMTLVNLKQLVEPIMTGFKETTNP